MATYNPNFSTQPSANAVPANQVVMAAQQQPHMLASGQQPQPQHMVAMMPQHQPQRMVPMVPQQQQPVMMQQPLAYAPVKQQMVAPVQQQMVTPVQQQMAAPVQQQQARDVVKQYTPASKPKINHGPMGSRQFTVLGVDSPHLLNIAAPELSWQMSKANDNNYLVSYDPAGKVHNVSVTYNDAHVEGSPFQLVPREFANKKKRGDAHKDVHIQLVDGDNHHLIASNVPDVDKLHFDTTMGYKLITDPSDAKKFHLKLEPAGKVHNLDVTYDGKMVPNGQFEFVPKAQQEHHMHQRKVQIAKDRAAEAKQNFEARVAELEKLNLNAPPQVTEDKPQREIRRQAIEKPAETKAVAQRTVTEPGQKGHMLQAAPQAGQYGQVMMSGMPQQPQAYPQQMMAAQPMMVPMQPMAAYNGGNMQPPMYAMQQQPVMYKQQ